jgi:small GTP-binding protein
MPKFQKIVVIGAQGVGKTQVIRRITGHSFLEDDSPTQGVVYFAKHSDELHFGLWDCSGLSIYQSVIRAFYPQSDYILMVLDASEHKSLEYLKKEIIQVKKASNAKLILVVNKLDLKTRNFISPALVREFMQSHGITMLFTLSAKENIHIDKLKNYLFKPKTSIEEKVFPNSYTVMWNEEDDIQTNTKRLLNDYCKGDAWYSSILLFACWHFNRHHITEVRTALQNMEEGDFESEFKRLKNLASITKGSLYSRLNFIQQKIDDNSITHANQIRMGYS